MPLISELNPGDDCAVFMKDYSGNYGDNLTLRIGQSVKFDDDFSLRFLNVTADSRCPSLANCIWAGVVTAQFEAFGQGQNYGTYNLTLQSGIEPSRIEINRKTLTLLKVDPYPTMERINESDYVVTIRVAAS